MKTLSIDIETYSTVDLAKCGVYKYTEAPDFDILLFGYSVDGSPVQVVDLACGETIPAEIIAALTDTGVTKWAFNAQFERICLSRWLRKNGNFDNTGYSIPEDTVGNYLNPASWKCTMQSQQDKAMALYIRTLKKQPVVLREWSDTIWTVMVEKAIVHRNGAITFVFKNGTEVKVGE